MILSNNTVAGHQLLEHLYTYTSNKQNEFVIRMKKAQGIVKVWSQQAVLADRIDSFECSI